MRTTLLFLVLIAVFDHAKAQAAMDKFTNDICGCIQKIKLTELNTQASVTGALAKCVDVAIAVHKKELKKQNVVDWDKGATEEWVSGMWEQVFAKCKDVSTAAFRRREELEEADAAKSFQGTIIYTQSV